MPKVKKSSKTSEERKADMPAYRNFCFTDFNVEDERKAELLELPVQYIVFQLELSSKTNRLHFQGYVELRERTVFNSVKAMLGDGVHFEPRRGTQKQARDYCMKEDTRVGGPWEAGEPSIQGKRNDLGKIKEMLDSGKSVEEIADTDFPTWCRNHNAIDKYVSMKAKKRNWEMNNSCLWGDAGTGKTRSAHDSEPDLYIKPDGKWFCGYRGQEAVLIDDFTGDMPLSLFLKVLDRYPMSVEVKGGSTSFLAKRVYVTSNLSPEEWYPTASAQQHAAIRRRFKSITHYRRGLNASTVAKTTVVGNAQSNPLPAAVATFVIA